MENVPQAAKTSSSKNSLILHHWGKRANKSEERFFQTSVLTREQKIIQIHQLCGVERSGTTQTDFQRCWLRCFFFPPQFSQVLSDRMWCIGPADPLFCSANSSKTRPLVWHQSQDSYSLTLKLSSGFLFKYFLHEVFKGSFIFDSSSYHFAVDLINRFCINTELRN